jgi:predicted GNAT family N-acyltransferase
MLTVRFGEKKDIETLRKLRKTIFKDELNVQEDGYQDVFSDFYSKNIIIEKNGDITGAVRLAFYRDTQKFYISYLMLDSSYRKYAYGGLLMGAILYLMKINNIKVVYADAIPHLLELYLKFGCTQIGEKYYKYGFTCPWIPVKYVFGTNHEFEKELIGKVKPFLALEQGKWEYQPKIALCATMTEYEECVSYLTRNRCIHEIIPHYCSDPTIIPGGKLNKFILPENQLHWHELAQNIEGATPMTDEEYDFDYYNRNFSGKNIIITRTGSKVVNFAQCYSMLTGKTVIYIDDWSSLPPLTERSSVLAFLEEGECTYDLYQQLRSQIGDIKWGIISGTSLETVSWMVIKNYLYFIQPAEEDDVLLSPLEKRTEDNVGNGYLILDKRNYDGPSVKEKMLKGNIRVLSTCMHGRGDIMYDAKHFFCGKSSQVRQSENNQEIIPHCQSEKGCYKDGVPTFAQDVDASLIAANTCFAYSNIFPKEYTVGWSFLKSNASHVISTERAKDGIYAESIFFLCTLRQGVEIGEAVAHLNKCIGNSFVEKECYLLFGDPSLRITSQQNVKQEFTCEHEPDRIKFSITPPPDSCMFYIDIDADIIGDINKKLYFYTGDNTRVNYFSFIAQGKLRVFIFKLDGLPAEMDLYLHTTNSVSDCFKWIRFYLDSWRSNQSFRLSYPGEKGHSKAVSNNLLKLAKLNFQGEHAFFNNTRLIHETGQLMKRVLKADQSFCRHLLDVIVNKSWIITDSYLEFFTVKENLKLERCYICGEITHTRLVKHRVLEEFSRRHYNCVNCGAIGDIPEGFILPKIKGEDVMYLSNKNKLTIEFTNPYPITISGYLGIRIYQSKDYQVSYSPGEVKMEIPPNSTKEYQFTVTLGTNIPRHLLFFKSIAVVGGAILHSQKNFYIKVKSPIEPAELSHTWHLNVSDSYNEK